MDEILKENGIIPDVISSSDGVEQMRVRWVDWELDISAQLGNIINENDVKYYK